MPVKPPSAGRGRGIENRASLSLLCEVRQGSRPWRQVVLEDLSPTGFRIESLPGTTPHAPLRIRIPGMQVLSAHVRWQNLEAIGCEFTAPLHVAVFEHLVKSAG